jgi:HlyD family secretion protein
LSVEGTIEIERLADVLYVGRPVFAQPNSPGTLFRIDPDGKSAERVAVRFGRASVNAIEIADGLKAGDRVILSDMAGQEQASRVRLN